MLFRKKCEFCKQRVEKGKGVNERVEVYGRVGTWKKDFCSEDCLERYKQVTGELMKTRRPNVCTRCIK
ncbi:MAG: hypothetical protein GTN76_03975 [Candidatus Aenigmarchaeota archaeon]|nr:hypothetical protein [Candidatus Aenigmarchaeota archaeon]